MRSGENEAGQRAVTYCVVPRDLAGKLHEPLRRHFRDDPAVEVIVERREGERRRAKRRASRERRPPRGERRTLQGEHGRRVGERRAALVPAPPPPLPRRARPHADRIAFVQRLEPAGQVAEDLDTARLVARVQAGDKEAFSAIYLRYFDRVYGYMRTVLRDPHEAEDATQQIFLQVLQALPGNGRQRSFRAWLFAVVRNYAIDQLRKQGRIELVEPNALHGRRAAPAAEADALPVFDWLTDRDLLVLVNRLSLPQRQVILLRYMLDLSNGQIARILGRTPNDVAALHSRSLAFIRTRLAAAGRSSRRGDREPVRRWVGQSAVLRLRRFALH